MIHYLILVSRLILHYLIWFKRRSVLLLKQKTPRSSCCVDPRALVCIQQGAPAAMQVQHYELSCRDVKLRHLVVFRQCEKLHLVALLDDPNPEAIGLPLSRCAVFVYSHTTSFLY